jgi:hypothetical protein
MVPALFIRDFHRISAVYAFVNQMTAYLKKLEQRS